MTAIGFYISGAVVSMATLYFFYLAFLSRDTHYNRNRIYLISSLLVSFILPALNINIGNNTFAGLQANLPGIFNLGNITVTPGSAAPANQIHPLLIVYLAGVLISFSLTLNSLLNIRRMIKQGRIKDSKVVMTNATGVSGFSAFGYIFLSESLSPEERAKITEHEARHINNKHFSDLAFIKIVSILFWFNPFIYLYERSLRAIHEFQADNEIISDGENILEYQKLLLNQLFRTSIFSVQSAFAGNTLIKKRLIMMTKQKTPIRAVLKLLLIIPLIVFLALLFSCSKNEGVITDSNAAEDIEDIRLIQSDQDMAGADDINNSALENAFVVVEEMPTFMGGDVNKFREWVQQNVKYPEIAVKNGIQGKVFVLFLVNPDGSVSDINIMRGVDPVLDHEVIRVVKTSPLWVPGKQKGTEVAVKMSITVNFQLE
ncbi:MAG: M56 family metallopeptidase [Marinilabiliaceae bacterium]|jgi:TonB family protein|nr:M56 family metallopeptidase [Marinilabiliaceae bacterium]